MLRAVTVTNDRGDSLEMDLFRPYKTGMNITDIDGIGPGKATVNSIEMYGLDGASFNSARLTKRQITMKIEFVEVPDIETVRQRTYRYFPIKREIKLTFKTDNRLLYIRGRVSGNEPDIFLKKESTTITVDCFDPFFYAVEGPGEGILSFSTLDGGFEFPFSNPVGDYTLKFGEMNYNTSTTMYYDGESETGVTAILEATYGPVVNPWIANLSSGETMTINTASLPIGKTMAAGDQVIINTRRGKKTVVHANDANSVRALMAIRAGSVWFSLQPGENVIAYGADSGIENMSVQMQYETIYTAV